MVKNILGGIIFLITIGLFINPAISKDKLAFGLEQEIVYLKNNIHYQEHSGDNKASYANWTNPGQGHKIMPVNTPVKIAKWSKGFKITNTEDGAEVLFEYSEKNMSMSIEDYLKLITSSSAISLDGLSEADKKGITEGKADVGMTKKGVMIALGYPASHRTPSLEDNTWYFWTNRFKAIAVSFNSEQVVESIK